MTWLEAFKACFGHRAQVLALRRYVQGLLSDSDRKSMEAMLARVTEPGSYQAFQHFITHAPWRADRVWRPRLLPEIWLFVEREVGPRSTTRFHNVNLQPTPSVSQIARLVHKRWAIEQQYQELKTELGLDHFEGRSFPGWHHHVVLTALTYNFLQIERQRARVDLTFPMVRGIIQEIFTAYLFAQRPDYLTRIEALRSVELRI